MTEKKPLELRIAGLKTEIEHLKSELAKWGTYFAENPSYAFEWSNEAFRDAARLEVWTWVVGAFEAALTADTEDPKGVIEAIKRGLLNEVLSNANHPASSTSVPSNHIKLHVNGARAELLRRLESYWYE